MFKIQIFSSLTDSEKNVLTERPKISEVVRILLDDIRINLIFEML